jgi:hypothetical protein
LIPKSFRIEFLARRRAFITLLGGVATWPLAVRAQQPTKLPTIGFVGSDSPDPYAVLLGRQTAIAAPPAHARDPAR